MNLFQILMLVGWVFLSLSFIIIPAAVKPMASVSIFFFLLAVITGVVSSLKRK